MNHRLFIADFVCLICFILQGMEIHGSEGSVIEILIPFLISIPIVIGMFYWIGFIRVDNEPEYVKGVRVWTSAIAIGAMIRFVSEKAFEPTFLIVILFYTIMTSGTTRMIHKYLNQ